jgi:hypothetical protein
MCTRFSIEQELRSIRIERAKKERSLRDFIWLFDLAKDLSLAKIRIFDF